MDSYGYFDYDNSMMNGSFNYDYGINYSQPMWNNYGSSYNYMPNEYNISSHNYEPYYDHFVSPTLIPQEQSQSMSLEEIVQALATSTLEFQQEVRFSIQNVENQLGQLTSQLNKIEDQLLCIPSYSSTSSNFHFSENMELEDDLILYDEVNSNNIDIEIEEPFHHSVINFEKEEFSYKTLEEYQEEVQSDSNVLKFDICHDDFNDELIDFVMPYNFDGLCCTTLPNINFRNNLVDEFILDIEQENNEVIVDGKYKMSEIKMDDVVVHDREGIG